MENKLLQNLKDSPKPPQLAQFAEIRPETLSLSPTHAFPNRYLEAAALVQAAGGGQDRPHAASGALLQAYLEPRRLV
jgi:hypothetical protein